VKTLKVTFTVFRGGQEKHSLSLADAVQKRSKLFNENSGSKIQYGL